MCSRIGRRRASICGGSELNDTTKCGPTFMVLYLIFVKHRGFPPTHPPRAGCALQLLDCKEFPCHRPFDGSEHVALTWLKRSVRLADALSTKLVQRYLAESRETLSRCDPASAFVHTMPNGANQIRNTFTFGFLNATPLFVMERTCKSRDSSASESCKSRRRNGGAANLGSDSLAGSSATDVLRLHLSCSSGSCLLRSCRFLSFHAISCF